MHLKYVRNQKGVAVVLLALSIVVLFGFGALAVDIGHLYNVKNQLQVAADAAALAGAAKLDGTSGTSQPAVREEAMRYAAKNTADVAYNAVPSTEFSPGASPGSPIPVALDRDADIIIGVWNGTDVVTPSNGFPANAVKVIAKRTGTGTQPRAQSMFARVLSLVPGASNYDFTAIGAVAIAATQPPKIVPIIVNEYWHAITDSNKRPYNNTVHDYPSSFVRKKEVAAPGNAQTVDSPAFGYTFAILGSDANSNMGSQDPNGYADMDYRSGAYNGVSLGSFHEAVDSTGDCATGCNNFFRDNADVTNVNNEKDTSGITYMVNGYTSSRLLPTAVYETLTGNYADKNGVTPNYPSDCPYATIFYFSTSGTPPINNNIPGTGGTQIRDLYPPGTKIIALVYDGTHMGGSSGYAGGSNQKLVTVVGYTPLEIDGYSNTNPKNIGLSPGNTPAVYAHNKAVLSPTKGNTMYAHVLDDIIQPDASNPRGGCSLNDAVLAAARKYTSVYLVGRQQKYGMIQH